MDKTSLIILRKISEYDSLSFIELQHQLGIKVVDPNVLDNAVLDLEIEGLIKTDNHTPIGRDPLPVNFQKISITGKGSRILAEAKSSSRYQCWTLIVASIAALCSLAGLILQLWQYLQC